MVQLCALDPTLLLLLLLLWGSAKPNELLRTDHKVITIWTKARAQLIPLTYYILTYCLHVVINFLRAGKWVCFIHGCVYNMWNSISLKVSIEIFVGWIAIWWNRFSFDPPPSLQEEEALAQEEKFLSSHHTTSFYPGNLLFKGMYLI